MLYVILLHWPCLDVKGREVATAITNMDIHDCSRVCLTYGVKKLYIVHPYQAQLDLAARIMEHWLKGAGAEYNPLRKRAFEVVRLARDMDDVRKETNAYTIATSAHQRGDCISWDSVRSLSGQMDVQLVFGTGWGLAPSVLESVDAVAEPIRGTGNYNHLSVRSAMAIALDRILGR